MSALSEIRTRCVIVGGGPAGMMAGYLLARAGVGVVVLEKHSDFNRDFRGDTIHPSTFELMHEFGLLDEFLKLPHQEFARLRGIFNGHIAGIADFSRLATHCKFIAFMPQWDFLNFFASKANAFPSFALHMQHEVVDLIIEGDRVVGVRAKTPGGERDFRADLVIGADALHAITHTRAGFEIHELGVPIDVLWMHISKRDGDPEQLFRFFLHGKLLVLINRAQYYQAGFVIPQGGIQTAKERGLPALHKEIVALGPFLKDRIAELDVWSKKKLLTIQINRLKQLWPERFPPTGVSPHAPPPAAALALHLTL